ncbi:MAG: beta-galactosidase, partial [Pseudomonadota bacterium]
GRWWVMEQQPGPVNWAPWNPAPLPGMVRLWSWEAFAHGAEVVSYFRWRQVPFGQEQMHAGLLLPDGEDAPALAEAAQVARELAEAPDVAPAPAPVALVFDYPSAWAWEAQPQGADFGFFALIFDAYRALRRAGLSVDVIPAETADLSPWRAVLAPGVATLPPSFPSALETCRGVVVLGPRTGAKTAEMSIPTPLPPNLPDLDLRITAVESLPPGAERSLQGGGAVQRWVEHAEGNAEALWRTADGRPALLAAGALRYLAGWPDAAGWDRLVAHLAERAGLETRSMPEGLRLRDAADARYVFNHAPEPQDFDGRTLPPAGVLRLPR